MKKHLINFWFWNTEELTERLSKDENINEGLYALFYYLIFMIIPIFTPEISKTHSYVMSAEMGLGFLIMYFVNKAHGNKNFIKKVVCLSLPITLRFMLISVIAVTVFRIFSVSENFKQNYMYISDHIFNILAFVYMGKLLIDSGHSKLERDLQ